MKNKLRTAVLLTGAAARISQEVAIIDKLIEKKGLKIGPDSTYLAGFSSGSLNVAAVNGCFSNPPKMDWDKYYKEQVLFRLTTNQVYVREFPLPFDTSPLRKTLNAFLEKMDAKILKDFQLRSNVLTFSDRRLKTLWASSKEEKQEYLNLSDLLMASTAIPFVFPWQKIESMGKPSDFPGGHFQDGGTGGTFKHFEDHLGEFVKDYGYFEEMYIISPMRCDKEPELEELAERMGNEFLDKSILEGIERFLGEISEEGFVKFLKRVQEFCKENWKLARNIYVCIPELENNYPIINFNYQKKQYESTCEWVDKKPEQLAIPIDEYVRMYDEREKKKAVSKDKELS